MNARPEGLDGLGCDVLDALVWAEPRSVVPRPTLESERAALILLRWELQHGKRGGRTEGAPSC